MKLTNKAYDIAKFIIQIFVPALIILVAGLGDVFGYDTSQAIALITLFATFGGSILGISNLQYKADNNDK